MLKRYAYCACVSMMVCVFCRAQDSDTVVVTRLTRVLQQNITELAAQVGEVKKYTFIQSAPWPDSAATERTAVNVFVDSTTIYILVRCDDQNSQAIDRSLTPRDVASGDRVGVYLSCTGDNETGYFYRLNAAGVQSDAIVTNDGRARDYSWDGVWYSEVQHRDDGWNALFVLPFKAMVFKPCASWRIGITRYIARKNESDWWPAIKVEQGVRLSSLAAMSKVEAGSPGLSIEVYPVSFVKYHRNALKPYTANAGVDVAWSPTQMSRLAITGNPDFAQIESDPERINVGRYESYFPEKRPFFIEGGSKFQTPIMLLYTRRIGKALPDGQAVPILCAGKYQHSYRRYELSMIAAFCGEKDYIDYSGEQVREEKSFYPIVRINRGLGLNSSLGAFYGAKENTAVYNRLYGIDGVWRRRDMVWNSQVAYSQTQDQPNGFAYTTNIDWQTRRFRIGVLSNQYNSRFYANGLGYVYYNGEMHRITAGPAWYHVGMLQSLYLTTAATLFKLSGDPMYTKAIDAFIEPTTRHIGMSIGASHYWQFEMGERYQYTNYYVWLWRNGERRLTLSPGVSYNNWTYNYRRNYFAPNGSVSIYASYRVRTNIDLSWQGNMTVEWKPDRSLEELSWVHEFWYRWTISRDVHFKVYYTPNWATHQHKANLLLSYNISPKSWLYIALNEDLDNSNGHPVTRDRVITLKASKLLWW